MKKIVIICLGLHLVFSGYARVTKFEPSNWWSGMHHEDLQLMVYGVDIASTEVVVKDSDLNVKKIEKVSNPNYLFIYFDTSATKAGNYSIEFSRNGKVVDTIHYPLWERRDHASDLKGFDPSDVLYLLMSDRFSNGDETNDIVPGLKENKINRDDPYGRHGGDLQGIMNHLDYLQNLGVTALWLNPILENDSPVSSYHGYGITDFYNVDARYGTNELYLELAEEARRRGMKIVMDMIFNHCGSGHWWMNDLPSEDWFNYIHDFRITNHKRTTNSDPYASDVDTELNQKGWFSEYMPDLNLENPLMEDYMIQNSIWWIEYLGLGGIRMDTHPYPGKHSMARWAKRVMSEYPNFNLTGEEWSINPVVVSYWQKGKLNWDKYDGEMPSMLDFPVQYALQRAFQEEENWNSGLIVLYEMLANDVLYPDPFNLVTFLGNHDMPRFYMEVGQDLDWYKNGLAYLLTTRGIPHLYYGDEILMTHIEGNDHGNIRKDFPGGWKGDNKNGFKEEGLSDDELEAYRFTKGLLNWRKKSKIVHDGKLMHFAPQNNVYVLFRYTDEGSVMVVLNKNMKDYKLDLTRFDKFIRSHSTLTDVLSGKVYSADTPILLKAKQPYVFEL